MIWYIRKKLIPNLSKKGHILTPFLDFYPGKSWNNSLILIPSCSAVVQLTLCKFCWYANEINLLKSSKNMVFWPIFDPKIGFLRFYPGKLRVITSKPLLIDSTVKNTSRKVYLEPLAYRAENARKSFYILAHLLHILDMWSIISAPVPRLMSCFLFNYFTTGVLLVEALTGKKTSFLLWVYRHDH